MPKKNPRVGLLVRVTITVAGLVALMLFTSYLSIYANTISKSTVEKDPVLENDTILEEGYVNSWVNSWDVFDHNRTKTMLVHFDANTSHQEIEQTISAIDGTLLDWIDAIHVAVVQVPIGPTSDVSGQSILATSDAIEHVESDGWVYGTYEPDDPDLYDSDRVYTAELLDLYSAWDFTTGDPNIVIAVLDTGITFEHPEFDGKVLSGYDYFNRDDDPTDDHGHGTHVAGTSAANFDNGIGTAGVCPKCSILPVKVLNQNNAGTWSSVAAGVTYAADEGANIIVMSLGSVAGTKTIESAIEYAIEKGVLIFAAAGNINSSKDFYPAAYDGVVGVAATDKSDLRWSLSNYGDYVDISAPGHLIYGAHKDLDNQYNGHLFMSGTSMATPHAAGLAGLLWSQDPSRSSHEIERLINGTTIDLGTAGEDIYFGHGRINPVAALEIGSAMPIRSQISGTTWQDTNANGVQDPGESIKVPNVLLGVQNLITDETTYVRSNNRGFWQIANASAGNYKISLEADGWIHTTQHEVFKVAGQQTVSPVNVGIVNRLPTTVVSGIQAERLDSQVVLTWQLNSDLISKIVVERSVGESDYQIIGQNVTGTALIDTRKRSEFVDTLPVDTDESDISYRFLIIPGETYIEGITVHPENYHTSALLPIVIQ